MTNVVISRRAARVMGFASSQAAVGQMANLGNDSDGLARIIGVVDDMRFESPNEAIPPRLYLFDRQIQYGVTMVRYQGMGEAAMRQAVGKVWRQVVPGKALRHE